jgi:two-component system LytT family response regulator
MELDTVLAPIRLSVVIVDDEPAARRTLRECCERDACLQVVGEYGESRTALQAIRATPPDILLLDIQMRSLSGIALARALDPMTLPLIVFVTAYHRYALDAFEVSAVDYVVKPFDENRLRQALRRVRRRHDAETLQQRHRALSGMLEKLERNAQTLRNAPHRIVAELAGRMHVLAVPQIEMVEADRNYVRLTVGRDAYSARSTLLQAEEFLVAQPMLKMSRSCLVNLNHVREISRTHRGDAIVLLAGGKTVTSSERFREAVRQQLEQMQIGSRAS